MIFAKKAIRRRANRKDRNGRVEKAQLLQSRSVVFRVFPVPEKKNRAAAVVRFFFSDAARGVSLL